MKLIYLHSSYRTNLKPREEREEKMKFSFWRCFSIFVRWPHKTLLFTSSLLISSEKYSTTFVFHMFWSPILKSFFVVNKEVYCVICVIQLVLHIGLKNNMQINVFRVNDNIPGFFLLLKGYIGASQMQCNKIHNL